MIIYKYVKSLDNVVIQNGLDKRYDLNTSRGMGLKLKKLYDSRMRISNLRTRDPVNEFNGKNELYGRSIEFTIMISIPTMQVHYLVALGRLSYETLNNVL